MIDHPSHHHARPKYISTYIHTYMHTHSGSICTVHSTLCKGVRGFKTVSSYSAVPGLAAVALSYIGHPHEIGMNWSGSWTEQHRFLSGKKKARLRIPSTTKGGGKDEKVESGPASY